MSDSGKKLAALRLHAGYSQRKLAQLSGISNTEIKRIEDGTRKQPSPGVLLKLAQCLEVPVAYLLGVAGPEASEVDAAHDISGGHHPASSAAETFYLTVRDHSMNAAHIPAGQRVLIDTRATVHNGDIACVQMPAGERIIRYIRFVADQVILYPANMEYRPLVSHLADIRIIGKVVRSVIEFE